MTTIRKVHEMEHDGRDGFVIVWEFVGFRKEVARFRAVAMTAMRFPTTTTDIEVLSVTKFDRGDFNVEVWVPTEGFFSAGIISPIQWLRENFPKRFRR